MTNLPRLDLDAGTLSKLTTSQAKGESPPYTEMGKLVQAFSSPLEPELKNKQGRKGEANEGESTRRGTPFFFFKVYPIITLE